MFVKSPFVIFNASGGTGRIAFVVEKITKIYENQSTKSCVIFSEDNEPLTVIGSLEEISKVIEEYSNR